MGAHIVMLDCELEIYSSLAYVEVYVFNIKARACRDLNVSLTEFASRPSDLRSSDVNLVHVPRQLALPETSFRKLLFNAPPGWRGSRLAVDSLDPESGVAKLLQPFREARLGDSQKVLSLLQDDICKITESFRDDLGYTGKLNVVLKPISRTQCPKFHADTVSSRCLCTYAGQGTWFIENKYVKRAWMEAALMPWDPAAVSVVKVEDEHAVQAQPGDLLFLKGHLWDENYGMGAVHCSPAIESDGSNQHPETRLAWVLSIAALILSLMDPTSILRRDWFSSLTMWLKTTVSVESTQLETRLVLIIDDVVDGGHWRRDWFSISSDEPVASIHATSIQRRDWPCDLIQISGCTFGDPRDVLSLVIFASGEDAVDRELLAAARKLRPTAFIALWHPGAVEAPEMRMWAFREGANMAGGEIVTCAYCGQQQLSAHDLYVHQPLYHVSVIMSVTTWQYTSMSSMDLMGQSLKYDPTQARLSYYTGQVMTDMTKQPPWRLAVFYGVLKDLEQMPKTMPNFESAGSCWVSIEELSKIPLRCVFPFSKLYGLVVL
eukprot:gene11389-12089_t